MRLALGITVPAVLAFSTLLAPAASSQQQAGNAKRATLAPDDEIRSIIKQRVDEKRSAGIVVGLMEPDGRTRIVAYGDPGPGQPPLDGNSVFEIGSISKVFTATALAQLVQDGVVKL